jgi:hypothetical protein
MDVERRTRALEEVAGLGDVEEARWER